MISTISILIFLHERRLPQRSHRSSLCTHWNQVVIAWSCVTQISLNSVFISDSHSSHLWCSTQKKPTGGERGLTSIACNNVNVHYSGCMVTSLLHKLTFECRARGEDFLQGCRIILKKKKLKQKLRSSLVDPVEKENFPGKWPAQ